MNATSYLPKIYYKNLVYEFNNSPKIVQYVVLVYYYYKSMRSVNAMICYSMPPLFLFIYYPKTEI